MRHRTLPIGVKGSNSKLASSTSSSTSRSRKRDKMPQKAERIDSGMDLSGMVSESESEMDGFSDSDTLTLPDEEML